MKNLALVPFTLVIFALVFAATSALATPPTEWEFNAVIEAGEGPGPENCRYWRSDPGVEMHGRHCVVTTDITGSIGGAIEITLDLDLVADAGNFRLRATITADDGAVYRMVADLIIQNGDISGPFKISGREGHIKGTLTAVLGGGAVLTGTGIRH